MANLLDAERKKILEQLTNDAKKRLSAEQYTALKVFINKYYMNVPLEDLQTRSINDLYGAVLSHWDLMLERKPGEYKRRIFNPQHEINGWQTSHTVIQVILDDQPFLVDTMLMEIERKGFTSHLIVHLGGIKIIRDEQGKLQQVLPFDATEKGAYSEAPIYIEIDRQTDPKVLEELAVDLDRVLNDARLAVRDWEKMREQVHAALVDIEQSPMPLEAKEVAEAKAFLMWLLADHFTFLGFRDYELIGKGDTKALRIIPNSGLGVLSDTSNSKIARFYADLPEEARKLALSKQILLLSKTNTKSTVHSFRYTDYIGVKRFDKEGEIVGERRFVGLYTSSAYDEDSKTTPVARLKVDNVLQRAALPDRGYAAKTLLNILETLPRDDLLQAAPEELYELAMGIFQLQERRRIRLFVRKDAYGRFISCLVFIPRDNVSTEVLYRMQDGLQKAFLGVEISFTTYFSDSILARIHYTIRINPKNPPQYDLKDIEKKLVEIGRSWKDDLQENLLEYFGEEKGNELIVSYRQAFPAGYREIFSPRSAIFDVEHMEKLSPHNLLEMSFYRPLGAPENMIHFKLFRAHHTIPLSDALPMLENMGLRVIGEQPYEIIFKDDKRVWINDFNMLYSRGTPLNVEQHKQIFQDTFSKIWHGEAENDRFNSLILGAQLTWREVTIIRAYAKYLRQISFTFSQQYMEEALTSNSNVANLLVDLFKCRFDPARQVQPLQTAKQIEESIIQSLDSVANIDEDRILRAFLNLINATTRTNYFQTDAQGYSKPYLSFKLNPTEILEIPLPKPMHEIFVYSPRFEGIHLRAGKVARGGIRWSDRREDFRTEVLGLMKAQQVKNAVIVPTGAKGGFVPKYLPVDGTREEIMDEAITCYKNFIRGLLDLTDNLNGFDIIPPMNTVRYDGDDSYLVVAADKGTATFSDIANSIAKEYNFWLDDAFASGGSTGYDHKKMGITARGAWESVKNHFQELNIDINQHDFTVVGIGDMAGDVFGNGMLLSKHIKLVGVFNHLHIFIDPNPNPEISFNERQRLFNLPRSSWEDYNPQLISKGGGVFKRSAKSICLSPEIKDLLDIKKDAINPNELIRALLKSPVDLIWNGGIGTFVKATSESNIDAGDRANDAIRINGNELTCRIVGEGGNLGCTQLARIEYELNGGRVNTDFIDNAGGVDCSDHEVNIKILLNGIVANGDMTVKQRNTLLAQMTDEISELVLDNNYRQARALTIATRQSFDYINLYCRYLAEKDRAHQIDRAFEHLPDDKTLMERKANGKAFTRPEAAVLSAFSKMLLKEELLNSDLTSDPYLMKYIYSAFPKRLRKKFQEHMPQHRLAREIVATQLSNSIITDMGVTFVYQMYDETRATTTEIIRAYVVAKEIFNLESFLEDVRSLDYKITPDVQIQIMLEVMRLIRKATRWFLRNQRPHLDIQSTIAIFTPHVDKLYANLSDLLVGSEKEYFEQKKNELIASNVPKTIAAHIASTRAMYSVLNIIEATTEYKVDISQVATIYFSLADLLGLDQFRDMINGFRVDNHWAVLARSSVKGDLDWQQRALTIGVLKIKGESNDVQEHIDIWQNTYKPLVDRWQVVFAELKNSVTMEYAMLAVAMRELLDLAQASLYGQPLTNSVIQS
jgi:glutamate dehydrogenase